MVSSKPTKTMLYSQTIGIDVSKDHLDFAVYTNNHHVTYLGRITNETEALTNFLTKLIDSYEITKTLFCLETTGMYTYPFLLVGIECGCKIWLQSALEMSQSLGVKRSKNDILDAQEIAEYAFRRQDKAVLYQASNTIMEQLHALLRLRKRLLDNLKSIYTPIKESEKFSSLSVHQLVEASIQNTIKGIQGDIKNIEQSIFGLLEQDPLLKKNYELVSSVVGVGPWTTFEVLLTTQNFTKFKDPKKYASYCGVVPFNKSSGRKKGRNQVSFLAHKGMKSILHMCALVAMRYDEELKQYYEKKCEEGKPKLAIINAIRNKIILRIFAVVKSGKIYQKRDINNLQTS